MNGMRLKASTGALSEADVVQINTLLTSAPGAMYRLPGKTSVGATSALQPARSERGSRKNAVPGTLPRT